MSFKRWEKEIDRGYNFLNHSLEVPLPLPQRPATAWQRVHGSSPAAAQSSSPSVGQQERASTAPQGGKGPVPSLDLQRAAQGEAVIYSEPSSKHGSKTVNIVRTGGFH